MKSLGGLAIISCAVVVFVGIKGPPLGNRLFSEASTLSSNFTELATSNLGANVTVPTERDDQVALLGSSIAVSGPLPSAVTGDRQQSLTALSLATRGKVKVSVPDDYLPLADMPSGVVLVGQSIKDPESFLPREDYDFASEGRIGAPVDDPSTYLPLDGVPAATRLVGGYVDDPDFHLPRGREHFATEKYGTALENYQGLSP